MWNKRDLLSRVSNVDIAKCESCKATILTVIKTNDKYVCPLCGSDDLSNPYKEIKFVLPV